MFMGVGVYKQEYHYWMNLFKVLSSLIGLKEPCSEVALIFQHKTTMLLKNQRWLYTYIHTLKNITLVLVLDYIY